MKLRTLDLFSGIGGFSLGLQRTGGFETIAFCEIDPFCRKVLAKHWPGVPCFEDITKLDKEELDELGRIDVICGGFPCQPVSCAGKRKGKEDARWLWPEFCRVVRCIRPEWVLIENVPGLLSADSGRLFAGILRDLSESGYNAEWNIVSAASVGAPHLRRRVFIVAHAQQFGRRQRKVSQTEGNKEEVAILCEAGPAANAIGHQLRKQPRWVSGQGGQGAPEPGDDGKERHVADPNIILGKPLLGNLGRIEAVVGAEQGISQPGSSREAPREMAHTICLGRHGRAGMFWQGRRSESEDCCAEFPDTGKPRLEIREGQEGERPYTTTTRDDWWTTEPDVGRVANGVPSRVDRLRALGNAIVPQCSQYVGQCVLDSTEVDA